MLFASFPDFRQNRKFSKKFLNVFTIKMANCIFEELSNLNLITLLISFFPAFLRDTTENRTKLMTLLVTLCTAHDWIISDCRNSFNNKLKNYEQAKNFFNPENTQSSSEESFKEKRKTFIRMCSFSHTEFMSWRFHNPLKYLKWCVLQKQLTVKRCQLFSQNTTY